MVLESNRYKESVHLFLHFRLANDEQVKEHLSGKLLSANSELEEQKHLISRMESTLSERMRELERKNLDFSALMAEKEKLVEQLKL